MTVSDFFISALISAALIAFGAALDHGIKWVTARGAAKQTKKRLYRNVYIESVDNLATVEYVLNKLEKGEVEYIETHNPPQFAMSAFQALEHCYFLTDQEQNDILDLHVFLLSFAEHNDVLGKIWRLEGMDQIPNILSRAKEELTEYSKRLQALKKHFF